MSKDKLIKRPKRNSKDISNTLMRAGISGIPIVGGAINELLNLVIYPSLEKRRDEWFESIAKGLKELEDKIKDFKIEKLKNNEAFVSVLMHSSQAAIKNHQKEKLEALRNAVLNTALPNTPEEDIQHMFLNFVDSFTPWHIKMLQRLDESEVIYNEKNWDGFCPELDDQQDLCNQIIRDLHSCGLTPLLYSSDDILLYRRQPIDQNVTDLGKKFLAFIASPFKEN